MGSNPILAAIEQRKRCPPRRIAGHFVAVDLDPARTIGLPDPEW